MANENMVKYFCGAVQTTKSAQIVDLETGYNGYYLKESDGTETFHPTSFYRNLITSKTTERRFQFEGVPATIADNLSGSVTVTDIGGKSYTVSFDEKITDGSQGTAVLEKESNHVSITKFSPHLRTVEVINKVSTYYANDKQIA